jgi:hypothetical protein
VALTLGSRLAICSKSCSYSFQINQCVLAAWAQRRQEHARKKEDIEEVQEEELVQVLECDASIQENDNAVAQEKTLAAEKTEIHKKVLQQS